MIYFLVITTPKTYFRLFLLFPPPSTDGAATLSPGTPSWSDADSTFKAFSTACLLTFSGTFSQYTSSRLPSTNSGVTVLAGLDVCAGALSEPTPSKPEVCRIE